MLQRCLAYLVFTVLMTLSIAGSLVVIVVLYLPMVTLKAVWQSLTGRAQLRVEPPPEASPH